LEARNLIPNPKPIESKHQVVVNQERLLFACNEDAGLMIVRSSPQDIAIFKERGNIIAAVKAIVRLTINRRILPRVKAENRQTFA